MENYITVINPIAGYSINEDGHITIYLDGETGEKIALIYTEPNLVESMSLGYQDASNALAIYYQQGPDAAIAYVNEAINSEMTDEGLEDFLKTILDL